MMSFDGGNPWIAARTAWGYGRRRARPVHVEPSAAHKRVRVLSAGSPSPSSRLTSRDGQRSRNDR